ncbi:thioredoxin-like protein [Volvox carteri f. nagariensis]|uniref:Thioredoxin-like protein n=1 Tax=Volvox carteri f. nagariensis TaxID=3068 RepID=D8UJJ9_VOLCA|nr:thioredoxin-like protein [Volvox carteri f. nagariensis]EFJ40082.1 thioredoxin-like protein [Volvox carteri f. nagariensis]|eukprot:XP_002958831.1 thioredoxin-like protein [Volvox carteri f. nagariensis]
MTALIGRVSAKDAVLRRGPAPCVYGPTIQRRATVVVRTSKEEAVKQLEQFGAGVLAKVQEPAPSTVPVTPLAAKSVDASASGSIDGGLLELNKDTFWEYLKLQGDTLVVVDFYTDWCGPCKLIYPELVKLSQERTDVRFVKVNCNKTNKELGIALGIKVAPTFQLYRSSTKVADMTGAKLDKLISLIDEQQQQFAASN